MRPSILNYMRKWRNRMSAINEEGYPEWLAYEPKLIPPPHLMRTEGIVVLEEWFRWAEEWSMMLRIYGKVERQSNILEIGCGLGRIAYPLRYIITAEGSYNGFEICKEKIDFLTENFHKAYPNFHFTWANIHNTYYNPKGTIEAGKYVFPYQDQSFDLVFAASVFTHLLPVTTAHYFNETARVLKPGGRAVFSFFILDNYKKGLKRPYGFSRPGFDFDHRYEGYGNEFAISVPENPEEMTAYKLELLQQYAKKAGLEMAQPPLPGIWSGNSATWVGAQDLIILQKPL